MGKAARPAGRRGGPRRLDRAQRLLRGPRPRRRPAGSPRRPRLSPRETVRAARGGRRGTRRRLHAGARPLGAALRRASGQRGSARLGASVRPRRLARLPDGRHAAGPAALAASRGRRRGVDHGRALRGKHGRRGPGHARDAIPARARLRHRGHGLLLGRSGLGGRCRRTSPRSSRPGLHGGYARAGGGFGTGRASRRAHRPRALRRRRRSRPRL